MPESKSFYTKDEFASLCRSMGYDPRFVASIRINPVGMYVTHYDRDAGTSTDKFMVTTAHEVR